MGNKGLVLALSNRGMAPAEIDAGLGLAPGEARRTMVSIWKGDAEEAALAAARRSETRDGGRGGRRR